MFYLILGGLIALYYFFMAPQSVRGTMSSILLVSFLALLAVLAGMSFMQLIQSPPEIFLGLGMVGFAYWVLRDLLSLPAKPPLGILDKVRRRLKF